MCVPKVGRSGTFRGFLLALACLLRAPPLWAAAAAGGCGQGERPRVGMGLGWAWQVSGRCAGALKTQREQEGVGVGKVTVKSVLTGSLSASRAPSGQGDVPPLLLSVHSREWPLPSPWTSESGTLPPWPRALSLQSPAVASRSEGGKRVAAEGRGAGPQGTDRCGRLTTLPPPPHPLSWTADHRAVGGGGGASGPAGARGYHAREAGRPPAQEEEVASEGLAQGRAAGQREGPDAGAGRDVWGLWAVQAVCV